MSPRASHAQVSFNGGHFSPRLFGRVDLEKYAAACNVLDNFLPSVQGPAIKRSGFRFIHEAKRTVNIYAIPADWGADVRQDGTKAVFNGQDLAGKDAVGIWRWAQKFTTVGLPGKPLSLNLLANVEGISTITAGFDVGRYGANGQDDPQADSGATMYSRCANAAEYLNDTALLSTTGAKSLPLGVQGALDFQAAHTAGATFSLSCRYANEAAAQPTGSWISEYTEGTNAPALNVTVLEDTAKDPVRLIPFEFSTDQAYILEFGRGYMRVHKDGGVVLESATKAISATTNATPVVVTTAVHGYADGDEVYITGTGLTALDNKYWYIKVLTTTTFQLIGSTAPGSTSATGSSAKVYTIATPYVTAGDVTSLSYAQSADTLYLAHRNYPPAKVTRTAHDAWAHTPISFDYFPFSPENLDEDSTVSYTGTTGSLTLTSADPIFTSAMVGSYIKIRDVFEVHHAPWVAGINYGAAAEYASFITGASIQVGDRVHNDNKVYQLLSKNTFTNTGKVPPTIDTSGSTSQSDGSYSWQFINYGYGYAQITAFTSATQVTINVIKTLPKDTNGSLTTHRWSFGGWSANRGYPKAVVFFEDRLIWAGTDSDPDTLFASRTGRYEDHRITDEDDSAMVLTLSSSQVNSIEWMAAQSVLQIGTSGAEWASKEADGPITPQNVSSRIKQRSAYGSRAVLPTVVENVVLFVQRSGRKLRELTPPSSLDTSTEEAPDLTLLADDYTTGLIKELAFQSEPDRVLWVIMENGGLYGFTYEKAQAVTGWHRHPVGGTDVAVESIAVIPHPDGDKDQLWAVIKRTINGATRRYLEALDPLWMFGDDIADAFVLDSGLTYSGAPATTISGLGHLEGQSVAVLADGRNVGPKTVSSGSITLSTAASKVQVGLAFTATLETMRIEAGGGDGVAQGDTKRASNLVLRIEQMGKGLFLAPSVSDLDDGVRTSEVTVLENATEIEEGSLYGGDTRPIPHPGGYEQKGRIALRHATPLPCQITAIFPSIVNYDR